MNKNSSIIIINGRHYDALTGHPLAQQPPAKSQPIHSVRTRPHEERRPEHHPAGHHTQEHAHHTVTTTHHEAAHTARQEHHHTHKDGYRPTRHIAPHNPEPARTLMRQAVKKPGPSVKRRIKVQGHLGLGGGRQHSRIITHRPAQSYAPHNRNHAVKGSTGRLISHFSPELFAVDGNTPLAAYGMGAVSRAADRTAVKPVHHAPASRRRPTTDEILEYAVHHAPAHRAEIHRPRRKVLHRVHAH